MFVFVIIFTFKTYHNLILLVKLETQFKIYGTYNLLCLQLHQQLLISKIPIVFYTSQITFIWFFFQGTTSPLFAIINFDPPALSTFTIFCSSVHRVFFHSCHFFFSDLTQLYQTIFINLSSTTFFCQTIFIREFVYEINLPN